MIKEIEYLKELIQISETDFKPDNPFKEILNLLENQQKEIEQLKYKIKRNYEHIEEMYISKQKIKNKIEELRQRKSRNSFEFGCKLKGILYLQELLEEKNNDRKNINRYYGKRLQELLYPVFIFRKLEYKFKFDKYCIRILAKPIKYKKYTEFFSMNRSDALFNLIHIEEFKKILMEKINRYYDTNIWE